MAIETIGKRIARLRQEMGWTQQALAYRLAISRVAVSHIEMDLTVPSERTITLIAGLFKFSPLTLVEGTTYPKAKTERLPALACQYTGLEKDLALLKNDLGWLARIADLQPFARELAQIRDEIWREWQGRLDIWADEISDEHEKELLAIARQELAQALALKKEIR